jgi:integrase
MVEAERVVEREAASGGDGAAEVEGFLTDLAVERGVDIRSLQDLMGHADVRSTEIYTQLARAMRGEITSPLDDL